MRRGRAIQHRDGAERIHECWSERCAILTQVCLPILTQEERLEYNLTILDIDLSKFNNENGRQNVG